MEESGIDRSHGRVGDDLPNSTPGTFCLTATLRGLFSLRNRFPFTATQQQPQTVTESLPISVVTAFSPYNIPLRNLQNPYPMAPPPVMVITEASVSSDAHLFRSTPIIGIPAQSVSEGYYSISINESHQRAWTDSLRLPPPWTGMVQQPMNLLHNDSPSWRSGRVVSSSMASSRSRSGLPYFNAPDENQNLNPIALALQKNEFGKMILSIAVPMLSGLIVINNQVSSSPLFVCLVAVALLLGFACTWNGVLLRQLFPRFADPIEQLGVVSILVAFFGMVGSLLPVNLFWVSWLCCVFSFLPFVLSFFK